MQPKLVRIPPLVMHGMKGIGDKEAYFVNCPTELYNYEKPDEYRISPYDRTIPYDWAIKEH